MQVWHGKTEVPPDGSSVWVIVREWDGVNHHVDYGVVFYDTDGPILRRFEKGDEFEHWPPKDVTAWMECEIPEP